MGTKVKGLLKGLKHLSITNIFDDKEHEEEIQIGFPTDVKHVAHIGMDDASTTTKPSWMEDFKAAPELAAQSSPAVEGSNLDIVPVEKKPPKDSSKHGKRRDKDKDKNKDKESSSHHRARRSSRDSNNLEPEDLSGAPKHSRKKKGSKGSSSDAEGSTKSSKKGHHARKSLPDSSLPAFPDESTR